MLAHGILRSMHVVVPPELCSRYAVDPKTTPRPAGAASARADIRHPQRASELPSKPDSEDRR